MQDQEIIELFQARNEAAISEVAEKYGAFCKRLAKGILGNDADADECVSDAYLALWNRIPPGQPRSLSAFLGKIVRNISLDRLDYNRASCRAGELLPILDEIAEIVSDGNTKALDSLLFTESMNRFLAGERKQMRQIFVRRYFFCDSVRDIAKRLMISESHVRSSLFRTRKKLAEHLKKEGFDLE